MADGDEQQQTGAGPLVITAFNQKGGIGKTTTSVNLAVCLAAFGKRVVLVDLDSQGNATTSVGVTLSSRVGAYELITGGVALTEAAQPTRFDGLSLVGSSDELAGIDVELAHRPEPHHLLRQAVRAEQDQFDFVVIDCPPALGMLPVNALVASDVALVPVTPQPLAHDGLHKAWKHIHKIRDNLNPELVVDGILITFASSNPLAHEQAEAIRREFPRNCLPIEIPDDSQVLAASKSDQPIVVFDPDSAAARAYLQLTQHFLAMTESRRRKVPIIVRVPGEDDAPIPRIAVVPPDLPAALGVLKAWRAGQKPPPSRVVPNPKLNFHRGRMPDEVENGGWVAARPEEALEIDWMKVGVAAVLLIAAVGGVTFSLLR